MEDAIVNRWRVPMITCLDVDKKQRILKLMLLSKLVELGSVAFDSFEEK